MSSATQDVSGETLDGLAEALGRTPQTHAELPSIVSTPRTVGWVPQAAFWTRVAVSVGVSLLGHAGVLVWLGYLGTGCAMPWIPAQPGRASIELQASLGSVAPEEEPRDAPEASRLPIVRIPRVPPPAAPQTTLSAAPTELRPRPWEPADLGPVPRGLDPRRQPPVVKEAHVQLDRTAVEPSRSEAFEWTADVDSPLPRTEVGLRRARDAVERGSIDSMASAASRAVEGAESSPPAVVYNPAPRYPPEALAARRTGRVVVRVEIARDGSVIAASVYVSSGVASLDRAALEAVRDWRFAPADSLSTATRQVAVPIRFTIVE